MYLNKNYKNKNLAIFVENFQKRYEAKRVPLLEALHPEIGIGYGESIYPGVNELISGLKNVRNSNITNLIIQDPFELLLKKKLEEHAGNSIILLPDDITHLRNNVDKLPATFSAIFNISGVNNDIISELHFSGTSATCLLGRFTQGNRKVRTIVKNVASFEENYYKKQGLVSEINILPNIRCGNVNYRSNFRNEGVSK